VEVAMIYIIWPEKRAVSDEEIASWYSDAVANGEIGPSYVPEMDSEKMAAALEDIGVLTVGKKP